MIPDVNMKAINDIATTKTNNEVVDKHEVVDDEGDDDDNLCCCPKNEMTVPVSVSVISTSEVSSSSSSWLKQYSLFRRPRRVRGLVGGELIVVVWFFFRSFADCAWCLLFCFGCREEGGRPKANLSLFGFVFMWSMNLVFFFFSSFNRLPFFYRDACKLIATSGSRPPRSSSSLVVDFYSERFLILVFVCLSRCLLYFLYSSHSDLSPLSVSLILLILSSLFLRQQRSGHY